MEKEEYTEWLFFVKPLREGQFPLLLRVSVVEKVGEKERVRDIVLEESVVIVAEPVDEPAEGAFKASGLIVGKTEEGGVAPEAKKRRPIPSGGLAFAAVIA